MVSRIVEKFDPAKVILFGSYAGDTVNPDSDVDIIVEFDRPIGFRFVDFTEYLENLLGKKVDVLTPAGVQGIRIERIAKDIEESIAYV